MANNAQAIREALEANLNSSPAAWSRRRFCRRRRRPLGHAGALGERDTFVPMGRAVTGRQACLNSFADLSTPRSGPARDRALPLRRKRSVFRVGQALLHRCRGGQGACQTASPYWGMDGAQRTAIRAKADKDFVKRSAKPLGRDQGKTTFIFVTPQRFVRQGTVDDGKEGARRLARRRRH